MAEHCSNIGFLLVYLGFMGTPPPGIATQSASQSQQEQWIASAVPLVNDQASAPK